MCVDCSCDNVGTLGSSQECEKLGGQCTCASNIVTRTCSACSYTYFGFDSAGCEGTMYIHVHAFLHMCECVHKLRAGIHTCILA